MAVRKEEFDLARTVQSGQVFRWRRADGYWLGADGESWWRVDDAIPDQLNVESNRGEAAFRRYFRLEEPIHEVYRLALEAAPRFAPELAAMPGLRLCRPEAAEETFFCFLCTPNNHLSRIQAMVRKLEALAGSSGAFPGSRFIAGVAEAELRALGFGYRAATICAAARFLAASKPNWLEGLRAEPYEDAFQALLQVRGVGPKLADCICLYGLHHDAAVPVDTHLWQAAGASMFPEFEGQSLTAHRYRLIGDRFRAQFGRHAGWVQLLLYAANMERTRPGSRKPI